MLRRLMKLSLYGAVIAATCLFSWAVKSIIYPNVSAENKSRIYTFTDDGIQTVAKTEGRNYYIYFDGKWNNTFLKGVNLGAGKPGAFPGELQITQEEYLRWFKLIGDAHADVIRVYTTMKPAFYDALYLYNKTAAKPLYLLQGVWVKEEDIAELNDAYADNERILKNLSEDAENLVDIFHGNAVLPQKAGFASGTYTSDVSPYVIGWILGIEWDPGFVNNTNKMNVSRNSYSGNYLYTENASPFEAFLCEAGDKVVDYEIQKYKMARPVSICNWPTTDMLTHPNEPLPQEDSAVVNMEHIKPRVSFKPGVFASYHIYPYYPDFMNYQKDYVSYRDESGNINTYRAYLKNLMAYHTMPVLVAEFGIPASRGMAHRSLYSGYNQGGIDENQQGHILQSLLHDIYGEGYCGALVFAWQDEWFKRTWNTMDLDLPDTRPLWSNPQTNEQEFGLLAFDPGKTESVCYVDGDVGEWAGDAPVFKGQGVQLYIKSDEKYLYLMAETKNFSFGTDKLIIPIDTIRGQGNNEDSSSNIKFDMNADFEIVIDGQTNSRILVDAYYDSFNYIYAQKLKMIKSSPLNIVNNSGVFNPVYLCLNRHFTLPESHIVVPFTKYETGAMKYGNGNPVATDYSSLADFCEADGDLEIRIPWQLLNVMDPSSKSVMGDLYKNQGILAQETDGFYLGAGISGRVSEITDMGYYAWALWEAPTYHERLKPSYYDIQEDFEKLP